MSAFRVPLVSANLRRIRPAAVAQHPGARAALAGRDFDFACGYLGFGRRRADLHFLPRPITQHFLRCDRDLIRSAGGRHESARHETEDEHPDR